MARMLPSWLTTLLFVQLLVTLGQAAPSEQNQRRAACSATNPNLIILKQYVANPVQFCTFWSYKAGRNTSPFSSMSATTVTNVCQCVQSNPSIVGSTTPKTPTNPSTNASILKIQKALQSPLAFCSFWLGSPNKRTQSPFVGLAAPGISSACSSITATPTLLGATSTTTSTSSSKSSTKSSSVSSTKTSSISSSSKSSSKLSSATLSATSSSSLKTTSMSTTAKATTSSSAKPSSTRITQLHGNGTASACGAKATSSLVPSIDPSIDTTLLSNLNTSMKLTLGYSLSYDLERETSANITFEMNYPAIALEHTSLVSQLTCSDLYVTLVAQSQAAFNMIDAWPNNNTVLVTQSTGCNPINERGIYLVTATASYQDNLSFTFRVRNATWADVASTMDIEYGTRSNSGCQSSNPSPTSIVPSYTNKPKYNDLSAPAKAIVDYLSSRLTYDSDGNIMLYTPPELNQSMAAQVYSPNDTSTQDALNAALAAAGLDTPDDLVAAAKNNLAGLCHGVSNSSPSVNSTSTSATTKRGIHKRFGWDDAWDIGCSDLVGAFTGDVGEAVCGAKDLYDSRDAIACMFTGCYSQTADPPPPTYIYTFLYSWFASFYFPKNGAVVSWSDGSVLTCVDCSYSISELKISGTITAVLATGEIKGATITVSESSNANMFFDLNTKRALSYNWNSALSTSNLDSITVSGVFNIDPTIIFSMGAEFSTDTAIQITAGSGLSLSGATADIDLGSAAVSNNVGWTPGTNIQNPGFTKEASVEFYPYMRRLVKINFAVMGNKISNTATLTSQTKLGFVAQVDSNATYCPENEMHLQTYLGTDQNLVFDSGFKKPLYTDSETKAQQCFNVPNDKPTRAEISSLAEVGSDFCTSYNNYYPPVSGLFTASTTTVPSTVVTTSISTIFTTPTITVATDATYTKTRTILTDAFASQGASGTQALATEYLKRDVTYGAMPTRPADLDVQKRALVTPAIASGWDASKLSYACAQIATGTSTYTVVTNIKTVTSGSTTITATSLTLAGASPSTTTSTNSHYTYLTSTSTTSTIPQATSCPLQDQVSCFTLTGHGTSYIEGKMLNVREGQATPIFDTVGSAFYLTCDGKLVSLPDMTVLTTSSDSSDTEIAFLNDWTSTIADNAVCKQDSNTGQLSCSVSGSNLMYGWVPGDSYWLDAWYNVAPFQDTRVLMPFWSAPGSEYEPIYMTYQETTCPCADPRTSESTVLDTSSPSCPAADGTIYTGSDGTRFQIQCNTDYPGNVRKDTSASTLQGCVNLCDADRYCIGSTWNPSTQDCSLKTEADSASITSETHAAIRLAGKPPAECGTTVTQGGVSYVYHCTSTWSAYSAGDGRMYQQPTYQACLDQCNNLSGCTAVSYSGGYCDALSKVISYQDGGSDPLYIRS